MNYLNYHSRRCSATWTSKIALDWKPSQEAAAKRSPTVEWKASAIHHVQGTSSAERVAGSTGHSPRTSPVPTDSPRFSTLSTRRSSPTSSICVSVISTPVQKRPNDIHSHPELIRQIRKVGHHPVWIKSPRRVQPEPADAHQPPAWVSGWNRETNSGSVQITRNPTSEVSWPEAGDHS